MRKLLRHKAVSGVIAIGSGAFLSQILLVITTPILSRVYPPDAFGAFSTLMALVSIVGSVAALKIEAAIILARTENDAVTVTRLSLISSCTVAILTAAGMWALDIAGLGTAWTKVTFAPLWAAALVFLTALVSILSQVALRGQKYAMVARRNPLQSLVTTAGQLGFGFFFPTAVSLVGGAAVGHLGGISPLIRLGWMHLKLHGTEWQQILRRYWRLPVLLAPSALLNTLGAQIPLLTIAGVFGAVAAGQFGMSQRIVYIPSILIGAAVAQVFGAELAKHVRKSGDGATDIYLRSSLSLLAVAFPTSLAVALLGPWLLPIFLGENWLLAGQLTVPLSLVMGFAMVASPTSQVYIIYQSVATIVMDASRVALIALSAWVSIILDFGVVALAWAMSSAQVVNYVISWIYGVRITRGEMR